MLILLRKKLSGNYELSSSKECTHKFTSQSDFKKWFAKYECGNPKRYRGKIIKATYSRSQIYFTNSQDVIDLIKKHKDGN